MQCPGLAEAFNGCDASAVDCDRQERAALYRAIVDMHDTGAALAGVATDMCAGQSKVFAQQIAQQRRGFDIEAGWFAIEGQS